MFTVMIVEDEMLVRIGLKNSINWEKLDMRVIAEVSNGHAAWESYQEEKPDLILTDIKMPVMDGMQLISKIRENDNHTKIIVLTCYEEFELVRQALKLGVSDYILKLKMSAGEMEAVLKKVREELKREESENAVRPADADIKINAGQVKESLIKDYMFYGLYPEEKFIGLAKQLKLRLNPERLVMCLMAISPSGLPQDGAEDEREGLNRIAVLNVISGVLAEYSRGEAIQEKEMKYILIFSFHDISSENKINEILQGILSRIDNVMKTYFNSSVTFGISGIYSGYPHLRDMHYECAAALNNSYFMSAGKFIRWENAGVRQVSALMQSKLKNMLAETNAITEDYYKEIEGGIGILAGMQDISKNEIQKMFLKWIHWPAIFWKVRGDGISKTAIDYAQQVHRCVTLDENIDVFRRYLCEISLCPANTKCMSREIVEAVRFIQSNYQQDISLQQVAEQVEMSTSYLSSQFKKEFQMSFVEYINQVRIDKAKEILLNTHLKSYQVAQKVGFTDESYFSRIFKKLTGLRPYEFKKQWVADIREEQDAKEN